MIYWINEMRRYEDVNEWNIDDMDYKTDPLINDLNNKRVFNNEFWIMLLMVLFIFGLGFITGSAMHDACCHVIEQLHKGK